MPQRGLLPVQRSSEWTGPRTPGSLFFAPNFLSVPETPVFCTECLWNAFAYTRSPSTVPRVHSVHQEAIYGTECYIGKNEKDIACAEFLKLPEKRRSPSARKENAIAKSAARNARMTKIVFYLLSSKFFRPKSTKSSKFICPVSVESSKSYSIFCTAREK